MDPEESEQQAGVPNDEATRWRGFMTEATAPPPSRTVNGLPARLCAACVRLLPVAGGSLSLTGASGRAHVTLCASDDIAAQLAELQYTLGEGPCHYASEMRAPVSAVDLIEGADTRRWPLFTRHAVEAGAGSAFSFPMGRGADVLGTVDLYNTTPSTLGDGEVRLGMRAADAIALALTGLHQEEPPGNEQPRVAWWMEAEANHEEVYRATGMLMVRLGVDAEEATARLRARAFLLNKTITEVARDVTSRRDDFRRGE